MKVGERIKNRRIELGYTQEELAEKMGYSGKSTICKAETCGDDITTTKVKKYAKALDCSFEYLMGWDENTSTTFDNYEAEVLAELAINKKMLEYVKKIMEKPPKEQEKIYKILDIQLND